MTEERKEARKAPRTATPMGTVTKTKDPMDEKAKAKAKVKCYEIAESKGTVGEKCPYKRTNSIH